MGKAMKPKRITRKNRVNKIKTSKRIQKNYDIMKELKLTIK